MILLVTSSEDLASMNIRSRLLELASWKPVGHFSGAEVLSNGRLRMVLIAEGHLCADDVDASFQSACGGRASLVVFASRHRSQSGKATLTVHPIGNYAAAEFGGRPRTLVPSAPREMAFALRRLRHHGAGLPYEISYEATHHGPWLSTPTFYIEIGSDESRWPDPEAAEAIARTVLDLGRRGEAPADSPGGPDDGPAAPIAVGVGGGHYAPRHTDVSLDGLADFGHIVPNHALDQDPEVRIQMALDATPGAKAVYFHRKSMKKPLVREMEGFCERRGVKVLRAAQP